jgi:flagellar biosynthesis anti-sigma factor FlgM
MKVQGPERPGVTQVREARRDEAQVKPAESNSVTRQERIQVSSLSKLLAGARNDAFEVDQLKVHQLRNDIESGAFKVDHERVAEAMLQEEA